MEDRITRQQLYIQVAALFAKRGACQRLKVGCVITRDNRIVATGYNGPATGVPDCKSNHPCNLSEPCTRAIHAEANAISFSAKHGIALEDTAIYCTHSPCIKCAELIVQSGIKEVFYAELFRDSKGIDFLRSLNIPVNLINPQH